jgi:D-3-phosphoglycerate dehydrogenase
MRILVVDVMHESLAPLLVELGFDVDIFSELDYQGASAIIGNYEGLIIRSKFFVDETFLNNATKLQFIGRAGAGLDLIDLEACERRKIAVFAANEGNKFAVAEHLLGMVLSLLNRGEELAGKTVGIIGFGHNGSESAKRFAAFGCRVLAYDKYKVGFGEDWVEECSLDKIFDQADIVSLHIPLTKESRGLANADFFSRFSKDIYFCNVARGEIMIQSDLIQALVNGKVKGACLDVLENEKLKTLNEKQQVEFDFLKKHPRVLITPHVGGWTFESYEKINLVLRDRIKSFLNSPKR